MLNLRKKCLLHGGKWGERCTFRSAIGHFWRNFQIKKTEYFSKWYKRLKDVGAQKKIAFRILQTEQGNFGDFKFIGDGIYEMRINYGPGYRIYYTKEDDVIVLLLVGGDKSTQQKDIEKAKELKNEKK